MTQPSRIRPVLAEARQLSRLAWPVMLTSLNWTLMHLIDVAVVGAVGTAELGALAASRAVTYVTIVTGMAGLSGVLVFVARADGAGDPAATGRHLRAGLLAALVFALTVMAVLIVWAEPLIRAIGVAPDLAPGGGAVLRAMALAYPGQFVLTVTGYFLEGISRPRRVTVVNLMMLPLNALLAWAWAGGHLGLPAEGAVGAAHATAVVSALGAAALLTSAWVLPGARARGVRDLSAAAFGRVARDALALVRFGAVPALASGLEIAGFSSIIALSTRLGATAAAAFQTVFSLHNLAFAVALGFGSAAGVRVGNAVGAGDRHLARGRTLTAAGMAAGALGLIGAGLAAASALIVRPFSGDPAVIAMAAGMLAMLSPFILFDGVQMVFVYALRALGDQVAAGVNGIIAFFAITGGLGWVFYRGGFGAAGLVLACGLGMVAAALLQGGRLWIVSRRPA